MENEKGGEEPFRRLELGFRLRKRRQSSDFGNQPRGIGNFPNSRLINSRALLVVSWLGVTLIGGSYPSYYYYYYSLWANFPLNFDVLELLSY
ncbi:hypothetical protein AVEN_222286-1 [Araneus ventricosus]|uniref:Transmembrane protein n=1 Tax=Araneus ventricosus TaxID=182803 RepID=A0A4Y2RAT3_ARAVE|nr:hypothetical protein AVEN_222286-1 [Araneus ventricosus]